MQWKHSYIKNYYISEFGDVYNANKFDGDITPSTNQRTGYSYVNIGGKTQYIHKLVCTAYHGPKPGKRYTVEHLDRDKNNNHYSNLAWKTQKENNQNRKYTKKKATSFTNAQYLDIFYEYATGNHNLRTIRDYVLRLYGRDSMEQVYSTILNGGSYPKWYEHLPEALKEQVREVTKKNTSYFRKK